MLHVQLFQQHHSLLEVSAREVVLPAEGGELSILDFHAPMLCVLTAGAVSIDAARFMVQGGMACVGRNIVTILAE